MTDREKLVALMASKPELLKDMNTSTVRLFRFADHLIANGVVVTERARPIDEWGEDNGDVLWWKFPIEEPPYVGSPLDANWPGYHTHWTPIAVPEPPKEVE